MLSLLKEKIEEVYGTPVSSARNCSLLAENISVRTGRSVSDTTIRRFFGLLPSKSSISKYNLDTLAMYCGALNYEHFSDTVNESLAKHKIFDPRLIERMDQITEYTLKSIERKSLGRFAHTIPRPELNRKLDLFLTSSYTIFPLIAPGGYGKTIGLAHWVLQVKETSYCLFCGAELFISMMIGGSQLVDGVRLGLDDPVNLYNAFLEQFSSEQDRLIVIIDGLDEMIGDPERLIGLVDYLFDTVSMYADHQCVKLVFSIREAAWRSYLRERFEKVEENHWFEKINLMLDTGYTNLPLLSNSGIRSIIANYNTEESKPIIYECIAWDVRELMRIPILLHFISRLLKTIPSLEQLTRVDVVREYVGEFLFRSKFAEEKEDIIWKLLELMDAQGTHLPVPKSDLKAYFPIHLKRESGYFNGYRDLLTDGMLIEERQENSYGIFSTKVQFRHQNIFVYLYALYLIRESGSLSFSLIDAIVKLKGNEAWIADIVAILYQIAYDTGNKDALLDFCNLPDHVLSSLSVRLTVGASFRKNIPLRNALIAQYAKHNKGRLYFFEWYVDTNYLFNNYVLRMREYMKHKDNLETRLFGHSILYLASFLKMNRAECQKMHARLVDIEPDRDTHPWPIGRKVFSQIIQQVFVEEVDTHSFDAYIGHYKRLAYSYPGYLQKGLIEFEMYIMIAMVLVKDYEGLYSLLNRIAIQYNLEGSDNEGAAILRHNQNSIPLFFLEYAIYKLGHKGADRPDIIWEGAIDNYTTNYDDYQYLLLLNLFLVDYYSFNDDIANACRCYDAALELARFAGYTFYVALFLLNDPLKDEQRISEGEKMVAASGFNREAFNISIGPCV